MAETVSLEIRFESIGGLGANLAGQLLAESLALRQNLNVSQFSSYGSEKKGTPVRSFIRVAEMSKPIRVRLGNRADVLAVFHEALLSPGRPCRTKGGRCLDPQRSASNQLTLPKCRVLFVDAMTIAVEENQDHHRDSGRGRQGLPLIDARSR
jgi:pyruvate ferredoxin oxidoreductase gamma subunit